MQYSIVSRNLIFIIFTFFVVAHMTQAYNVSFIAGDCYGIWHTYVTDCNGKVIHDVGFKPCDFIGHFFKWYDAPSVFCVHAYPQLFPKRNRYISYTNVNACLEVDGNEFDWSLTDIPVSGVDCEF
ncbi:hypothetical protein C1645_850873 [Glomus cerebriforme]|uniref:Uncharacterized protein n=1 Tax=Glomus cerebriforme TaxID=658196 RepID=A0A397SU52_9GLOM|nr:hypothetical protein C1645_850862 [Glomus cerebriforme]RIA89513.1 hypothetical protein C1645_850873 [Glomus cerebriforme]